MPSKQQLIDYLRHKKDVVFTVEEVNVIINKLESLDEPAPIKRDVGDQNPKSS